MPLVTLTCSSQYFPPDEWGQSATPPSNDQMVAISLAREFPKLIMNRIDELNLGEETTANAVEVNIAKYHEYAVNNPHIGVRVTFTEPPPGEPDDRLDIRGVLIEELKVWFAKMEMSHVSWALDIFWGPGHGAFTGEDGSIVERW